MPMSDDEQAKSAELYRAVNDQLERQNAILAAQYDLAKKMAEAQGINISSLSKSKTAYDGLYGSTSKQTAAAEANAHGLKVMEDAMANFSKAAGQAGASLGSFSKALLSNEQGFAKYNQTLSSAGDAAMSLTKNFGLFGQTLGIAIKGLTMAAEQFTKQADNTLKATDSLSKLGGAGSLTADKVLEMGHKAGLSSSNLDIMTKAAAKANTGMAGMGATVGDGIKAFGDMTAVTKEQRMAFQRMGVSQEELMAQQADYVKLQELSGINLADQAKQGKNLKAASLDYAENLVRLSALTGKSADDLAKEKMIANEVYEEQIQTQMEQVKIRQLREEGRKDEADDLLRAQQNRKRAAEEYVHSFGKEQGLQMARAVRTGTFDQSTAGLATIGFDPAAEKRKLEQAKSDEEVDRISAATRDDMKKKRDKMLGMGGTAAVLGGEATGKALGLGGVETAQAYGRMGTRDEQAALTDAQNKTKGLAKGEEGAGGAAATDPAQIARNKLTETEIAAKVELDKLIASFNPLLKGFDGTTLAAGALMLAATAAAAALTKMAASAAMEKLGMGGPDAPDKKGKKGKDKAKPARARDAKGKFAKEAVKDVSALGKMAGSAGKVASVAGKFAGPAAGVIAVGAGAMTAYEGAKDVDEKVKKGELTKDEGTVKKSEAVGTGVGQAAGGAGGAWAGAAAGAAMGSVVPVVGTVIGGLLGAAVGGWLGSKGGEIVGQQVGKNVGKSLTEKPLVDASGRATAATDPRVVGTVQTTPTTQPTEAVKVSDIQANMAKGMTQQEAQKAAEAKADKSKTSTDGRASAASDPRVVGVAPNLDMENPAVIAKQMKEDAMKSAEQRQADTLKLTKASDAQETSLTTLNRTLLSTNNALKDLTKSITDITNPKEVKGTTGTQAVQPSQSNKPTAGGGISVPGGIPTSFKSVGGTSIGGSVGGSMPSDSKKTTKPTSQQPEGSENGTESASKTVDLAKIMKFGSGSGTQDNFEALNSTFKDAVVAAATEYNSVTGNKLTINSAKRDPEDQQRLWDESVAAGRPGKGPTGMAIGKPGRSLHEKGEAVDIQNYKDPDAVAALNKQGLTQKVPGDPVHFQALNGGIMDGADSGYPVEGTMHGREAIIPLNPDSIITKLLDTSESQLKQEMNNNNITTTTNNSSDATAEIIMALHEMMEEKFDAMIDILEDGNNHTEKLVKFSAV